MVGVYIVVTGAMTVVVGCRVVTVVLHELSIAARVFGPTDPQPVVAGVPDETMLCVACQVLTAAVVRRP